MKLTKSLASIVAAAIALIASVATSQAVNRTLILLQENSKAKSYMTDALPAGTVRAAADAIIDRFVPNGEVARFQAQVGSYYQRVVNLSDTACTRTNLLNELIKQSKEGYTVDLEILGHGSAESLRLSGSEFLTGQKTVTVNSAPVVIPGSIRTLLTEARIREGSAFNFRLRLVHMCNSFGATTNDDWLAIGAKVAVGAPLRNWMPEPMITVFWNGFLKEFRPVTEAATDSLAVTRAIWAEVPNYNVVQTNGLTRLQETQQTVSGFGGLIAYDENQLALNQSRSFTISAMVTYSGFVYLVAGQTYTFSASTSDVWTNGHITSSAPFYSPSITTNANGYTPRVGDVTRFPANMMCLIGELFRRPSLEASDRIVGSGFAIGTSRTITPTVSGWLYFYANEHTNLRDALDNSGEIKVTVTRILPPASILPVQTTLTVQTTTLPSITVQTPILTSTTGR